MARRLAASRWRSAESFPTEPVAPGQPDPIERAELAAVLDDEVRRLPPLYRDPVVLCELQGRSRRDVAAELGVPDGTLSSRLAKAKKLLAERLAGRGFAAPALGFIFAGDAGACVVPAALATRTVRVLVGASPGGAGGGVPPAVDHAANGVIQTMIAGKLKGPVAALGLLVLGVGGLLAAAGGAAGPPLPQPPTVAVAAPIPAKPAPPNLIWINDKRGFVALDQTGRVCREVGFKNTNLLIGEGGYCFSPAQNKYWFAARTARPSEPRPMRPGAEFKDGFTLHVRGIDHGTEVTDLAIPTPSYSRLARDGSTVCTVATKAGLPGNVTRSEYWMFENSLTDVPSRKETKLDLPGNHQLMGSLRTSPGY